MKYFSRLKLTLVVLILIVLWAISGVRIYGTKMIPGIGLDEETRGDLEIMSWKYPCPPELTNLISNTNLFSQNDRQVIMDILEERKGGFKRTGVITNFNETYKIESESLGFYITQFKNGKANGLGAHIQDEHCISWIYYSNGLAVDKWLQWIPDGSLIRYVKFKRPYDWQANSRLHFKIKYKVPWPFSPN